MPKINFGPRFLSDYVRLPMRIQVKVDKALRPLANNPRHPSLQTKPIQRAPGIYECRINQNYRLSYERLRGDILLIRRVGLHDDTIKAP